MVGFAANLILAKAGSERLVLQLILGAPAVPALLLLVSVAYCYESPRFYMRRGTPNYDPEKAWQILRHVRNTPVSSSSPNSGSYRPPYLLTMALATAPSPSRPLPHPLVQPCGRRD